MSLASALERKEIAFGRGGFCVHNTEFLETGEPINIAFHFMADGYALLGQGIIQWLATGEEQMGVELTYVAETSRARAVQLAEEASSFIPRTTEGNYRALAG